jgi:hypothetical protein
MKISNSKSRKLAKSIHLVCKGKNNFLIEATFRYYFFQIAILERINGYFGVLKLFFSVVAM